MAKARARIEDMGLLLQAFSRGQACSFLHPPHLTRVGTAYGGSSPGRSLGECGVGPGSMGWGLSVPSPPAVVHGSRPEEVIDHRLTEREWAEEWKHLNNVSVQARAQVPQSAQPVGLWGQGSGGLPFALCPPGGHGARPWGEWALGAWG